MLWFPSAAGVYNVLSGMTMHIPMCVQPMKNIAAVALAGSGLTLTEAMAAGIFVSSAVMFLGLTRYRQHP
jgi:hypothetical protein